MQINVSDEKRTLGKRLSMFSNQASSPSEILNTLSVLVQLRIFFYNNIINELSLLTLMI